MRSSSKSKEKEKLQQQPALTKNSDLQTGQTCLNLWVDVGLAKVNSNSPGLHFKLLLCNEMVSINCGFPFISKHEEKKPNCNKQMV